MKKVYKYIIVIIAVIFAIFFVARSAYAATITPAGQGGTGHGGPGDNYSKGDTLSGGTGNKLIKVPVGSNGQVYTASSTATGGVAWTTISGTGSVTSVDMTVPTGLSISGNPITTNGTLALSLQAGYNIPLTASTTNWNNFYNTPSNRITAGTNLSWSGNTLNGIATTTLTAGGTTSGTSLNLVTTTDTNILLSIVCTGSTCTFNPTWNGTLADARIASAATWNAKLGTANVSGVANQQAYFSGTNTVTGSANNIWNPTSNTEIITGSSTVSNIMGIGTTTPQSALTVQGTTANLLAIYNGATAELTLSNAGILSVPGVVLGSKFNDQTNFLQLGSTSSGLNGLELYNSGLVGWSSTTLPSAIPDVAISRISTSTIAVGTGAQGNIAGNLVVGTLGVGTTTGVSPFVSGNTLVGISASSTSYAELAIQNKSSGTTASTDITVNSNQATPTSYYGNFGVNSSGFINTGGLSGGALDVYLHSSDSSLYMGTSSSTNSSANIYLGVQNLIVATGTKTGFTFLNATTTGLTVTGNVLLSGVSNCNGLNYLQITSGGFGCGTPAGGGGGSGAGWATGTPQSTYANYPSASTAMVGINTTTPIANLSVVGISGSTTPIAVVASSTGMNLFTVASNGNVGVGTSTPRQNFYVTYPGTPSTADYTTRFAVQNAGYANTFMSFGADSFFGNFFMWNSGNVGNGQSDMRFATASDDAGTGFAELFRMTKTGRFAIGTGTPTAMLAAQGQAGSTTDMVNIASSTGVTSLSVTSAGNVGVGTSTPRTTFAVTGGSGPLSAFDILTNNPSPNTFFRTLSLGYTYTGGAALNGSGPSIEFLTANTNLGNIGVVADVATTTGAMKFQVRANNSVQTLMTLSGTTTGSTLLLQGYSGGNNNILTVASSSLSSYLTVSSTGTTTVTGALLIPVASASVLSSSGQIAVNTVANTLSFNSGGTQYYLNPEHLIYPFYLENPGLTNREGNNRGLPFFTANATTTITKILCINADPNDSVTFNIFWDNSVQTSTTSSTSKLFTSYATCNATTTPTALTITGSTTLPTLQALRFAISSASTSAVSLTIFGKDNQ